MRCLLVFIAGVALAQTSTTIAKPKTATRTSTAAKTATKKPAQPELTTEDQKTIYALGLAIYKSVGPFNLSPEELALVKRAMSDAAAGKPLEKLDDWGPKLAPLAKARTEQASEAYLTKQAAEPGSVKTDSGLIYREITPGTGPTPKSTDTVKVNYRGTLVDGTEFDSSYKRNQPAQFVLNHVIPCWTEGLQKMKVGGKATLVCPAKLAYGDRGMSTIPPNSTLTFEVELLDVPPAPTPAAAPVAPPAPKSDTSH